MLSHTELTKKGHGGAQQAADYLFASEYYVGRDGECASRVVWLGKGAQALGLEPGTSADAVTLSRLLEGYRPDGVTKLTQNAGRPDRRLGHDLTFSADKSISVLFAAASPQERERLLEIHHRAGEAAVAFLQTQIAARRGHAGARRVAVDGLVIARVDHFASRELQAQLHSHYCVANLALGVDGQWSTFDAEAFVSFKHAAGALYRAEMARGFEELGYQVESRRELDRDGRETGQVWHQVAGIGSEALRQFSKRREQIKAYMDEHGVTAQEACLRTRQGKEGGEPDAARIIEATERELDEMRDAGLITWATVHDLRAAQGVALDPRSDEALLERLHATESAWGMANLIDLLAKERGPQLGAEGVLAEAEDFLRRNALLELTPDRYGRPRWASQAQHDLEQGIADRATARAGDLAVRVLPEAVREAIAAHEEAKGFTLTDEQRRAVQWVASETGGVACLTGRAGTGKTATAGAYIKAFEANGQRVLGACAAWDAADKLAAETGLETYSTASLLSRLDGGQLKLTPRDVVLVDEAGMVGARTVARLQKHIDEAGGKLVLVGDALQLQPVEAGAPFRLAQGAVGHSELTEIRRQKEAEDRELANAFYGRASGREIVGEMMQRGQLRECGKPQEARDALVAAYLSDSTPAREKLAIAATNDSARQLTHAIRGGLKERGELQNGQAVQVAGSLKGETREMELAPGDRVRFGLRNQRMGVSNGTLGVVESIEARGKHHRLTVRLESDIEGKDGKLVHVDTAKYQALDYGYAGTVHKAQGQGKRSVYWLANGGNADRHLGLVAFTRTKERIQAFTTPAGLEKLEQSLDDWRLKQNAAEMLAPRKEPERVSSEQVQEIGELLGRFVQQRQQAPERAQSAPPAAPAPQPEAERQERLPAQETRQERQARERAPLAQACDEARDALLVHHAPIEAARKDQEQRAEQVRRTQGMLAEWETATDERRDELESAERQIARWRNAHPMAQKFGFPPVPPDISEAQQRAAKQLADAEKEAERYRESLTRRKERMADAERNLAAAMEAARPALDAFQEARNALAELDAKHKQENRKAERYESERQLAEMGGNLRPRAEPRQSAKSQDERHSEDLAWVQQVARDIAQSLAKNGRNLSQTEERGAHRGRDRGQGLTM